MQKVQNKITLNAHGGLVCTCGNEVDTDGFDTCLKMGTRVAPTGNWVGHYICNNCNTVAKF
jgi:hypothetical protein